MEKIKFTYRSTPIFHANDKEAIQAWESRQFDTMLIFCKLYRNEEGKQGIGYVVLFEDGWEYGSFSAHLRNLEYAKACLAGLYEILKHVQELKPKRVIIWAENKKLLEQLTIENIQRDKKLRDLYNAFPHVHISNLENIDIENIGKLRETAFSSARSGSKFRSKSKLRVLLKVSEAEESEEMAKYRQEQFVKLMAKMVYDYATRPIDEKIRDAKKELQELETNPDEEPDFGNKRNDLLQELDKLNQEKLLRDSVPKQSVNVIEDLAAPVPKNIEKEVNQTLVEKDICFQCGKKIKPQWKFCPYCSKRLN